MPNTCCNIDWPRSVTRGGLVAGLFCGLVLCGIVLAVFQVPAFYAEQLAVPTDTLTAAGESLKQQVQQFSNDVTKSGPWQIELSEDQINAWLASELLDRLPRALPPDVYNPKIAIQPKAAHVAALYNKGNLSVVLSMEVDPSLTDRPNEIALRIRSAKIGSVPGLVDRAKQSIQYAALCSRVRIRWQKQDGDWVAHFDFDKQVFDLDQDVQLSNIELQDGVVRLCGKTLPTPAPFVAPPILASQRLLGINIGNVDEVMQPPSPRIVDRNGRLVSSRRPRPIKFSAEAIAR